MGVMTDRTENLANFSKWPYRRDPTHICFYAQKTFLWIAKKEGLEAVFPCQRVVLLKRV